MKRFLLCQLSLGLAILSAETPQDNSQIAAKLPDPASIRFTPPPPPKDVPRMSVKGSTTADFGTHRITILRGEPSTLPDIPKPPPPAERSSEISFAPVESVPLIFVSGTTYGKNLSRVGIWNPVTQTRHSAWCGWDISLIAPFHEITHQGKSHSLLMGIGKADTEKADGPGAEVIPGSILVPDGDEFTASLLTSLRKACFDHTPRLVELKAAREQYEKDAAAWKVANPTRPQNHTIWIEPHRGSRYLKKTSDDQKEGTR